MTSLPNSLHLAKVVLFDMDRTLVDQHTAKLYIRYLRDIEEMRAIEAAKMGYWLLRYTIGSIDAEKVATQVLSRYRGHSSEWLRERCRRWFTSYVEPEVSPVGRQRVREHLSQGQAVALATSAVRHGAQPLADALQIPHVLCSDLEEDQGLLTGGFLRPLCYGRGKLEIAEKWIASQGATLAEAVFYTDSVTDLPLLEKVAYPIVVNPDPRLRRIAKLRGWPIEHWKSLR